jgi:hemoglobin
MKQTTGIALRITLCGALTAGLSARAAEANAPLYERLGGRPAIRAVVADLLNRLVKDDRVNAWFHWAAYPDQAEGYRTQLADFICQATGGPCEYKGLDLQTTHQGLHITKKAFQSVVEDLTATLNSLKVPEAEKSELLGLLAPLESQIVQE